MYYVKHTRNIGQKRAGMLCAAMSVALLVAVFIALNVQLRKIISESAQVHAQNMFSQAVSEAVNEVFAEDSCDISILRTGENGQVMSVETDITKVGRIRSEVTIKLLTKLKEMCAQPVSVSLGTLTGLDALAGLGPEIEMRFELRGGVSADIVSDLQETAINQSLHTIDCIVSADYFVILPGCRFSAELCSTVPLAQSVIVGEVPEAYTYVVGDQSDTIGRIFDYGQQRP